MKGLLIQLTSVAIFISLGYPRATTAVALSMDGHGVTPIRDGPVPVNLLKTGARTYAAAAAGGQQPLSTSLAGGQDLQQDELSESEARILEAVLKESSAQKQGVGDEQDEYEEDNEEYGDNYDHDEDEDRCPEQGEILFVKSQQCVPRKCPTGTRRDLESGFCHRKPSGWSRYGGIRSYSPYYRGTSRLNRIVQRPRLMYPRFRG